MGYNEFCGLQSSEAKKLKKEKEKRKTRMTIKRQMKQTTLPRSHSAFISKFVCFSFRNFLISRSRKAQIIVKPRYLIEKKELSE